MTIRTNTFGYLDGNLVAETNELGLVTLYTYDKLNRLVCTTYPDSTTVSNLYDKLDLVGVKDRLDQWTRYGYNPVRQLLAMTNVNGQVTEYQYCSCGSPSRIRRWNGATPVDTDFLYDMAGRLTNVVHADGYQLNYTYNTADLVETVTDSGGHTLHLDYVQLGQQYGIADVLLNGTNVLHRNYDEYGRVISSVDRNGITVTNGYDFLKRLVARQSFGHPNASGASTGLESFVYDARGLTNYFDTLGRLTKFVRDEAGRVSYETNANSEVLRFTYNAAGELLTLTDGKGQQTSWNYDTFGRVTNKVDAASNILFVYKYDPLDRLTNRWSIAKSNTVYKYDPIGNLTNVFYVGQASSLSFAYDALNRLTNMLDAVGTTAFTWTAGDQLAGEAGPWASDTVSYTYANRLRSALSLSQPNASAWAQTYAYDELLRLTNVTSAAGVFGYEYPDNNPYASQPASSDRVKKVHLPGGNVIENSYDGLARLLSTALKDSQDTTLNAHQYGYDQGSQRTQQVFTAGNYVNYNYDNIGQLQTARGWEADETTPRLHEQFGYGYDAAWNLNLRTNNALIQTFNVNTLNELTTVTNKGTLTVAGTATEPKGGYWSWGDPPGVTNVTVSGTGLSSGAAELYPDGTWARTNATLANGNNSYTATAQDTYGRTSQDSVTVNLPATNTFVYDLNGNLRTNNTRIFDYDDENQLIRITEPSAWKSEFSYDGKMRRRVRKEYTWSGGTWLKTNEARYVYDQMLVIQERDANNLPLVTYTRGNDLSGKRQGAGGISGLLARTDMPSTLSSQISAGAHAYYHSDAGGNVTALVGTNGVVLACYRYDPYGDVLTMGGQLAEVNTYRYSSKQWHRNSGLYHYGFRFYSPSLQRWVNRDPIGEKGGLNLYTFVHNYPVGHIDSFGNCPLIVPFIAAAAGWLFSAEYANAPGNAEEGSNPAFAKGQGAATGLFVGAMVVSAYFVVEALVTSWLERKAADVPLPDCDIPFNPNDPKHQAILMECVAEAEFAKEMSEEVGIPWTGEEWMQYMQNCMEGRGLDVN